MVKARNIIISLILFLGIVILTLILIPSGKKASIIEKPVQVFPNKNNDDFIPPPTFVHKKPDRSRSHPKPKENMVEYENIDKVYDAEHLAKLIIFKVNDREKISLLSSDPSPINWQKPFILLLHDAPSTAQIWDDIGTMKTLVNAGYRVRALNLPGRGATTSFQADIRNRGLWLREVLDDFSLYPLILVSASTGSSYGTPLLNMLVEENLQHSLLGSIHIGPTVMPPVLKLDPIPTIFIYGEHDPLLFRDKERLQTINSVKINIINNTKHNCWTEDPEEFNNVLLKSIISLE